MSDAPELSKDGFRPAWLDKWGRQRPDVVFMAPFMVYLLFLPLNDWVPAAYMSIAIAVRGVAGIVAFWLFRPYLPKLGHPHVVTGVVAGLLAAVLWVKGQHILNGIEIGGKSLGGRFFLFPGRPDAGDPSEGLSAVAWWSQVVLRVTVACITVPIVEEIFWRGFLLRALISWDRFEEIPLGRFTWISFLGTSLLSMLQHPDNWGVSIFCWFFYNALMYWKKSLLCMMIAHGVTNLTLYVYVIMYKDWLFW